jgi:putative transposase
MKYAFIQRNKLVWPICVQCRVLLVSVSGYHEHLAWRVHIAQRRHLSDETLLIHISAVYAENRGRMDGRASGGNFGHRAFAWANSGCSD